MSNEYVIAHAACPVCGVSAGEECASRLGGVHAGRHSVLHLPTLDEIAAGRRLREGLAALAAPRD
jgi:hypothetical protein